MPVFTIVDKFTSSSSDDYNNDSDFIQHIVLSGHTSYASLMNLADSDNIASWAAIKDSCAAILQSSTYSNFDQSEQSIMRSTDWPADSAQDVAYHHMYRKEIEKLNAFGAFRITPYVRRNIRRGTFRDSDGNNWGSDSA